MTVFLKGQTYDLRNPEVDLWSLKEIHRVTTWPRLPIGLNGKYLQCEYHLVKPWDKDPDRCYLVLRSSNHRVVKFSKRFYDKST